MIPVTREMLQPTELLIRLRQRGESSHYSKPAGNAGNWPISAASSHTEGRSPLFLFQGSLHLLSQQKKEHSMRLKQDPSTTLSTGRRMGAMHKHCCRQFNSLGRMWIILDLIQAGYRGQLYGNACILQISSREWNYGETAYPAQQSRLKHRICFWWYRNLGGNIYTYCHVPRGQKNQINN